MRARNFFVAKPLFPRRRRENFRDQSSREHPLSPATQATRLIIRLSINTGKQTGKPGGGDSDMKWTGMLVVSLRGVNFGFWSRLGCSGQNVIIFSRQGLV